MYFTVQPTAPTYTVMLLSEMSGESDNNREGLDCLKINHK